MSVYYEGHGVTVHHGDCLDVLKTLPDCSVDSVVTDPPYGLEFMGKEWDRPWAVTPSASVGYEGREDNLTLPSHRDGRNANCRACGGRARGAKRCTCASPKWDRSPADDLRAFQAWCEQWATECLRVLKPGGHLLAFGGSRTYHRMTSGVEDAGFEIRDCITWHFGSGFPKSLDVSKAIDRAAGAERDRIALVGGALNSGTANGWNGSSPHSATAPLAGTRQDDAPATPDAERWQGWGTALKPATEFIVVARKPLTGTVAATVLEWGTGALNIDACRVGDEPLTAHGGGTHGDHRVYGGDRIDKRRGLPPVPAGSNPRTGRWPANVVFDEHQAAVLDEMSGESTSPVGPVTQGGRNSVGGIMNATGDARDGQGIGYADRSGASRYFFVAREDEPCTRNATDADTEWTNTRTEAKESAEDPTALATSRFMYVAKADAGERPRVPSETGSSPNAANRRCALCKRSEITGSRCECPEPQFERETPGHVSHPTVKPLALMRWLVRLVTPPGGTVLEPFAGSGTTVEACIVEGFHCIAIEKTDEYLPLILSRITRRRDPVAAIKLAGEDLGLFDVDGFGA